MTTVPDAIPQPRTLLRYNGGAVALHWMSAALILAQIYVGFTFHGMERGPVRGEWFTWHKTLGALILILGILRLVWRLMHKPPPFPPELSRWERFAAVWNHRAFYVLIIALPLTGLAAISGGADEATTRLAGGIPLPLIPGLSEAFGDAMGETHEILVKLTIALLILHVGAALKHQFIDRDGISGRMPPFPTPRDKDRVEAEGR
ncbi:cytochrome b [Allosphingosinicella vermicomposti]|uniref:cytochrome b n=1 Tax=Allosphingosinicella vermicomposti TaxID=614671 RepID=UPI000D10A2F6|nr:cytochrome b/b6 domain-containing protein [Allosphingosinicella vermicomposti]